MVPCSNVPQPTAPSQVTRATWSMAPNGTLPATAGSVRPANVASLVGWAEVASSGSTRGQSGRPISICSLSFVLSTAAVVHG